MASQVSASDPGWAWDRYWHANRIASCMDGAGQSNYDQRVADGWIAFFDNLPTRSRILDLCTGNGAIAALAAETGNATGRDFSVTGIDLADIDPLKFVTRYGEAVRSVDFRSKVDCEALPFPDSSFDAVISQYGIEYSDVSRSLGEAVRMLAPGGRLRLAMHAAEGKVVAEAYGGIADAEFLLGDVKLCAVAARCIEAVVAVERPRSTDEAKLRHAKQCFADFQAALSRTHDYLNRATDVHMVRHSGSGLLHAFQNRRHFDLQTMLDYVETTRLEIDAHRLRQVALVEAAVNSERLTDIAASLGELGLSGITCGKQGPGDALLGHVIEGRRPA